MKIVNIFIVSLLTSIFYLNFIYLSTADDEIYISANEIMFDKKNEIINANGNVLIKNNKSEILSDSANYFKKENTFVAKDNIKIIDEYNNTYYTDTLKSNIDFSEVNGGNIKIRLKDNARIVGSNFIRINNINAISNGQYTPCNENNYLIKNCPGWKLKAKSVFHDQKSKTIHYDHSVLYLLNIPVLYTPYFSHPDPSVKKKTGFLAPTIRSDDRLGQSISIPYFYNINTNKDFTFTPTIQSAANNYLTSEFRLLNKNGNFNIKTNINDNKDNFGSKHYLFADAELNSQINKFQLSIQTSNDDTYMKKNQLNKLDILTSGVTISDTYKGNIFLFEAKSYKHLTATGNNQWEYLYPKLTYNISNLSLPALNTDVTINNEILRQQSLSKEMTTSISSQINFDNQYIDKNIGLIYENFFDTRLIYHSVSHEAENNDIHQIRLFSQFGSKISYPLKRSKNNISQILKPIVMPILAPYNNYTDIIDINNSNIFARNRSSTLAEWESGPRINYGAEWFLDYKDIFDSSIMVGQSLKFNKNKSETSEEISDLMSSIFLNLNKNIYTNAEFVIDRKKYNINKSNLSSSFDFEDLKIKIEYDYVSNSFQDSSEQFGFASKIKINKDINFIFSGKRDLELKENIGYETGISYENDCLAINFKYYRDLTKFKDIEDTRGLSLLITLKPFGSNKSFGKSRTFGPKI